MHLAVEISILTLGNYFMRFLCPGIFRPVHYKESIPGDFLSSAQ